VLWGSACGPRQPGAEANKVYYWKVNSSEVAFSQCTDDPTFREAITPVKFDTNSYFIYRVSADKGSAVMQNCSTFNPSSCKDAEPSVVMAIAANEYVYSDESKDPIGTTGCNQVDSATWSAIDSGETLALTITHVLSLTDATQGSMACTNYNQAVINQSPNKTGLQGCVVTFSLGMQYDGR
jgi:hypothetical protein